MKGSSLMDRSAGETANFFRPVIVVTDADAPALGL
jgi:hypothetical protein